MADKDVKVKLTFDLDEASLAKAKIKAEKEINEMSGRLLKTPGLTGDMINMSPKEMGALSRSVMRQQETNGRKQIQFREAQERREYNARERVQSEGAGLFGGYQMRRGARMIEAGKDLVAAQDGVKASTVSFGKALGATIGELAPMAMAMGAVSIASMALSAAFNLVEQTGMEVVGALSQIAGAKGLQQLIVDAADQERMAAKIAANSNLGTGQVLELARTMSSKSEFGDKDIGSILTSYLKAGGSDAMKLMFDRNGKPSEMSHFTTDLASVSLSSPSKVASGIGTLAKMFPSDSAGQIQDKAAALWKIGTLGGGNFFDNPEAFSKLFPEAEQFGIGVVGQAGLGGAVSRGMGGRTRQAYTSLLKYEKTHRGIGNLASDILNPYNDAATTAPGALRELSKSQGIAQTQDAIQTWVSSLMKATDSMSEFNKAVDKQTDTSQWSFKMIWNKVNEDIEGGLLPVLRQLVQDGTIQAIADMFKSHKDDIVNGVKAIAQALPSLAAAFLAAIGLIVPALSTLADWIFPNAEAEGDKAKNDLNRGSKLGYAMGSGGPGYGNVTETPLTEQEKTDLQSKVARGAAIKSLHDAQNAGLSSANTPMGVVPPSNYQGSGQPDSSLRTTQKQVQLSTQHLDVLQLIHTGIQQLNGTSAQIKTNTGKPIVLPPNSSAGHK